MNPNYVHTITIYHKQEKLWIKTVLENCFWKSGIAIVPGGTESSKTQVSQTNTYTVRIPMSVAGSDFEVSTDDIVILGECQDDIAGKSPDTAVEVLHRHKPDAFKVTAFADNTSHLMDKHYRLGG